MQNSIVFAGPSAEGLPTGGYKLCPPASAGDVDDAIKNGFRHIILADTLFFDATLPHTEIMRALNSGITVFGVSSAGALRAVELRKFGMIGAGSIYNCYKHQRLADDGELASPLHSDYTAAAPPLVQLRYFLGAAADLGIKQHNISMIFARIKNCYFTLRTYKLIEETVAQSLTEDQQLALGNINDEQYRIKMIDLKTLLLTLNLINIDVDESQINVNWLDFGCSLA
jgi:hypothetical protein